MILEMINLKKSFPVGGGLQVHAVNDVSLKIAEGESLGIVGESGSGKSTLARVLMGLETPTGGDVLFDGRELSLRTASDRTAYWRQIQMIFQDPFGSLNPRMRIGAILREVLVNFEITGKRDPGIDDRIRDCLELVGLPRAAADRLPHELSGGQRQRVAIAAALIGNPRIMVADEAVSALDVSVQAQIVNLLADLRRRLDLTFVFITHDLRLASHFCDRVAIMYLGQVVEVCAADELLHRPRHPYTQALISAVPSVDPEERRSRVKLTGEIPSPLSPPSGCPFHPRCAIAVDRCRQERPQLDRDAQGHAVACHLRPDTDQEIQE